MHHPRALGVFSVVGSDAYRGAERVDDAGVDTCAGLSERLSLLPFREVWAVDFEFIADPGEHPRPVCLVAWELRSGRKLKLWRDCFGGCHPTRQVRTLCS